MKTISAFKVFLLTALLFLAGPGGEAGFQRGQDKPLVFPATPFLGMQVTYTLTGVTLEPPVENNSYVKARIYRGQLTGNTLTLTGFCSDLTGICHGAAGDSFLTLKAALWVGGQRADFVSQNPCAESAQMTAEQSVNLGKCDFSLTLPIPAQAENGGFSIRMTSLRNGSKIDVLEISGVFASVNQPLANDEIMDLENAAPIAGLAAGVSTPSGSPLTQTGQASVPVSSGDSQAFGGGGGTGPPAMGIGSPLLMVIGLIVVCVCLAAAILVVRRRGAAAAAPAASSLKVQAGLSISCADGGTEQFRITMARTTIGRGDDNLLVLHDGMISTHHAEIVALREGFCLRDMGSINGTTVNGKRVTEAYLALGDEIGMGTTRLIFSE
jgi:hypothetical protein